MSSKTLTRTLVANAGFSGATGLAMLVAADPLARWLGIPLWLTVAVGAGLLPFAMVAAGVARNPSARAVKSVIVADAAWVVGAAAVIIGFPQSMSSAGLGALGLVTIAVAGFALFQMIGLRRSRVAARG